MPSLPAIVFAVALGATHARAPRYVKDYVAVAKMFAGDDGPDAVLRKASWLGSPSADDIHSIALHRPPRDQT